MNVREMIEFLQTQDPTDEVRVLFRQKHHILGHPDKIIAETVLEMRRQEFAMGKIYVAIRHAREDV